ncbi:MAG TPA: polysaccharide pyruvyl transferase CsaB [bacterium]|nr:polysaccharide pyruvyl transferase CsaB [bacterium]
MTSIVISGYYGFANVGDEAVLASMLNSLRNRIPDARFVVLSADPAGTTRLHGVPSISRVGPGVLGAITGADLFISGGGSLIQDATSARSALYYVGVLAYAARAARRSMVFAQGLGPIRRRWIRALVRRTLDRVHVISFRDEDSQRLAHEIGVRRPSQLVADPVFALDPAPFERAAHLLEGLPRPRFGLVLRPVAGIQYVEHVVDAVRSTVQHTGGSVVALVFHRRYDLAITRHIAEALQSRVISDLAPSEMMAVVGALDVLAGVRLHALIAAVAAGVAPVGLSYDPKVESLFRKVGAGYLMPVAGLQPEPLKQALLAAWEGGEALRPQLLAAAARLREEALRATDLAASLLSLPAPF